MDREGSVPTLFDNYNCCKARPRLAEENYGIYYAYEIDNNSLHKTSHV